MLEPQAQRYIKRDEASVGHRHGSLMVRNGKVKGPVLRGLASRAPYFHNGSAATLEDVVDFYDTRFVIGFTAEEKADLVAFLRAF